MVKIVLLFNRKLFVSFLGAALFLLYASTGKAQQTDTRKWSGKGLRVEIAALSKDTVKAFFIGRGFSSKDASFLAATGCVFRSAIGNAGTADTDADIKINLTKWRVHLSGNIKQLMTRKDWAELWRARAVNETPAIAFHWALFPTEQQYKPTDYNWGMLTFNLPPQTRFDLQLEWQQGDATRKHLLKNLECGE